MEKGVGLIMEDLIKELVDRLLRVNNELYIIMEKGYQNQINMLHDQVSAHKDTIQEQRKVILEFKEEVSELKKGIKEDGKNNR